MEGLGRNAQPAEETPLDKHCALKTLAILALHSARCYSQMSACQETQTPDYSRSAKRRSLTGYGSCQYAGLRREHFVFFSICGGLTCLEYRADLALERSVFDPA